MHNGEFPTRRRFLGSTALAGVSLAAGGASARMHPGFGTSDFVYEVALSEAEWRGRLSEYEYSILRQGGTEWPKSSELWNDYRAGDFQCRGCDLPLYSSDHRAEIDKGWVFFAHARPDAVLTGIDTGAPYGAMSDLPALIEVHCRRCGSHLGHVLNVDDQLVHCINGTSLTFRATAA